MLFPPDPSFVVIPTKLDRDIAADNGHLVREFDLKLPWPLEMAAIFRVWNHIFARLFKYIMVIPMYLGRDIAGGKGHLVREFDLKQPWPREIAAILIVWNHIFTFFSKSIPAGYSNKTW